MWGIEGGFPKMIQTFVTILVLFEDCGGVHSNECRKSTQDCAHRSFITNGTS